MKTIKIIPSISVGNFTAGKTYIATFVTDRMLDVRDDFGRTRLVSYPLGGRCPHLKRADLKNLESWVNAGHWMQEGE